MEVIAGKKNDDDDDDNNSSCGNLEEKLLNQCMD